MFSPAVCHELLVLGIELVYFSVRVPKNEPRSPKRAQGKAATRGRRVALWLAIIATAIFVVDSLVGERGLLAMLRARQEFDQLAATIARERETNARLRSEIRRLKEDPRAIEEIARRDLGLMKAGEKVFIIKDIQPPSK
jgi:cell division protein FtsB